MLDRLSNFASIIVGTCIFVILLQMIIPDNKSKKYISFVLGIIVTYTLISPILNIANIDINEVLDSAMEDYHIVKYDDNLYEKSFNKSYEQILIDDIVNRLKDNGYKVSNVEVEYDEITYSLSKIYMNLETSDGYVQKVKVEVSNSDSSNQNIVAVNDIKNILSSVYGINKENIYID